MRSVARAQIYKYGDDCGCKVAEIDQIPARVQSEGGYAEGESGSYEEVSDSSIDILFAVLIMQLLLQGGLQAKSQIFSVMRTMLS